jgi:hypothetical protein
LGCQFIRNDPISTLAIFANSPLPRPLTSLASRPDLITWLTRILFNILLPGNSGIALVRARLPNNLAAFFGLLVHLQRVGYPGHWIGEFLSSVIGDNVVTDVAPYMGKWPIPLSDINRRVARRKVRLDPWKLELENILANSLEGIPFFVTLPVDFTTDHTDITTFEASFRSSDSHIGTMLDPYPPFDPVICLLFYKPGPNADDLVRMLPNIFEGNRKQPEPGTVFVLTSQELVDYPGKRIQWKMSRKKAREMRTGGWNMVAYRTDCQKTCGF